MMDSSGVAVETPLYAVVGKSRGGSFEMWGGVDPAVGVFDAGEARCAGAGEGVSTGSAECCLLS